MFIIGVVATCALERGLRVDLIRRNVSTGALKFTDPSVRCRRSWADNPAPFLPMWVGALKHPSQPDEFHRRIQTKGRKLRGVCE